MLENKIGISTLQKILLFLSFFALAEKSEAQDAIPEFYIENIHQERKDVSNQYWDIQKDHRGMLYLANYKGIYEYDGVNWILIPMTNNTEAYSLAVNKKGRVYASGKGELGYMAPNQKGEMRYVSLKARLPEYFSEFKGLIVDIEIAGDKIAFVSDNFMFVMQENDTDSFTIVQALGFLYSVVAVDTSIYIIDGSQGFMELVGDHFEPVPGGQNIVSYVMMPYKKNKVIIVSPNRGFILYDPQNRSFTYLSQKGLKINSYDIKSGIALNNGRFALGSVRYGCIITDSLGHEIYKVNSENGLIDNSVYSMSQDNNGNLWLSLSKGAAVIYDRTHQKLHEKDTLYTFAAFVRSVVDRKNNGVLFAGNFYNKTDSIQSDKQSENQYYKFDYEQNGFRFTFSTNQYYQQENIQYQYYLEGLEDEWGIWTGDNNCEYTNLDWGKYTFHVRAKNELQDISKKATYSFQIKVPWYSSWWFYSIQIGVLSFLLVLAAMMYRLGKSKKMAGNISGLVVVIIFKYLMIALGPLFAAIATGIIIFDILTSVIIAYIILPAQNFTNRTLEKILNKSKMEKENEK